MKTHPRYRHRATQTEAARIAGVEQPTVSGWNKGSAPELVTGLRLAEKLNVCVEWLYTERGPMRPLPADDIYARELMACWDRLSDEEKRKIVHYAQVGAEQSPLSAGSESEPRPAQS